MDIIMAEPERLEAIREFHAANPELYKARADGLDLDKLASDLMADAMRRAKGAVATANRFVSELDPEALAAVKQEGTLHYFLPTDLLLYHPDVYEDLEGGSDIFDLHDATMELLSLVAFEAPEEVSECLLRKSCLIKAHQLDA